MKINLASKSRVLVRKHFLVCKSIETLLPWYTVVLITMYLLFQGKAISGYDHFGNCGREDETPQPAPRQAPAEENIAKQEQETNPRRKVQTKPCPRCHRRCPKENSNNNHLKCQGCKTSFCYQCGKEIKGAVTMHFTAASSCVQHSDD